MKRALLAGGAVVAVAIVSPFGIALAAAGATPDPASCGTSNRAAAPTGADVTDVWANLLAQGFTEITAAGVMGNMQTESGFDPLVVQGGGRSLNPADAGGGGYGLVQWTPGAKLTPLLHGASPSIASEVAALAEQLRTTEAAAGAALAQTTTPEQAAGTFGLRYERYAGPPQPARASQARAIYNRYAGSAPVVPGQAAVTCTTPAGPVAAPTEAAAVALRFALDQVGEPYRWGSVGPDSWDCSGLTQAAYAAAGINLSRTSRTQWYDGQHVDRADLQPGDLVFWANDTTNPGTIHHVALYLGTDTIVAAPHAGALIRTQPMYWTGYIGAVRPTA